MKGILYTILVSLLTVSTYSQTLLVDHKIKTDDLSMFYQFSDGTMIIGLYEGYTKRRVLVLDEEGKIEHEIPVKVWMSNTDLDVMFISSPDAKHKYLLKTGSYGVKMKDNFMFELSGSELEPVELDFGLDEKQFRVQEIISDANGVYFLIEKWEDDSELQHYSLFKYSYQSKQLESLAKDFAEGGRTTSVNYVDQNESRIVFSGGDVVFDSDKGEKTGNGSLVKDVYSWNKEGSKMVKKEYVLQLKNEFPLMVVNQENKITAENFTRQPWVYSVMDGDNWETWYHKSLCGVVNLIDNEIEITGLVGSYDGDLRVNKLFRFSEEGSLVEQNLDQEAVLKYYKFGRSIPMDFVLSESGEHIYFLYERRETKASKPDKLYVSCSIENDKFTNVDVQVGKAENYEKENKAIRAKNLEIRGLTILLNEEDDFRIPICNDIKRLYQIEKKVVKIYTLD